MTCHACRGLLRPDDGAICALCRALLLAEREALNPEAGMVGKLVRDRYGAVGTVVEWHEYAGYCLLRLLDSGRIVRRYTSWVVLG